VNAATKLGAFGVVLAVALAGGAGLGAAVGPEPDDAPPAHGGGHDADAAPSALPGLAIADQGYRLDADTTTLPVGTSEFRFRVIGPDGHAVTAFEVEHEKELHLIAVSRDLTHYAHLHPTRAADGTWSIALPDLTPGVHRVLADFTPADGPALTLGVDVTVPGDHRLPAPLDPSRTSNVDGFDVELSGEVTAGRDSTVTIHASRDGAPAELQPYLGANGHLVAIRDGDLAYLHVHPEGGDAPGEVTFAVEIPSAGRYRLFFDFQVDGVVRTADFTVDVPHDDAHGDTIEEEGSDGDGH
jgi:hypothetical protein